MSNTVPTPAPRATYIQMGAHLTLAATWADSIGRVVIAGGAGQTVPLSIHLDPEAAAQLASDLISAVSASGAGEVPSVLLHAFDRYRSTDLTTAAVTGLVDSLEAHEGAFSERERHLCTTLLHGLAADRRRIGEQS